MNVTVEAPVRITQSELGELSALFDAVIAKLRDLEARSDPDNGGSVEPGQLRLDSPLLAEDIDILTDQFRVFIPNWQPTTKSSHC